MLFGNSALIDELYDASSEDCPGKPESITCCYQVKVDVIFDKLDLEGDYNFLQEFKGTYKKSIWVDKEGHENKLVNCHDYYQSDDGKTNGIWWCGEGWSIGPYSYLT